MDTEATLTEYREIRSLTTEWQTAALNAISTATLMEHAKRIGLARGSALLPGAPPEMTLMFDLAVHTAKEGRSRAIDRLAKQRAFAEGSREATIMNAIRNALFTVWQVEGPHEIGGLNVRDVLRQKSFWLMDEWLAKTAKKGDRFAARLADLGEYRVSCGVIVPVSDTIFQLAAADARNIKAPNVEALLQDRRFAETFYKAAIQGGAMRGVAFREPG
jgi:molybdopterin-biosynthesis enzyme MoeA-like protein